MHERNQPTCMPKWAKQLLMIELPAGTMQLCKLLLDYIPLRHLAIITESRNLIGSYCPHCMCTCAFENQLDACQLAEKKMNKEKKKNVLALATAITLFTGMASSPLGQ